MLGLIFTYAMTIGGAIGALFIPFIGLLVYICFAIIQPESLWPWSVTAGNYSRIVAIATLAGWAIHSFGSWNLGKSRGIMISIAGLLLWSALSALGALDQNAAWSFVDKLSKIVVPFVVGLSLIRSADQLKHIAWVISVSHGYLALEFNQLFYAGRYIRGQFHFAGLEEGSISIGMISAMGLSIFFGLYQSVFWKKIILFVSAALMGHVVLFSYSRGGILGLLTSLFVSIVVSRKSPKTLLVIALALLLGLRLAGPEVRARFMTIFDSENRDASSQSRLDLWYACWQTMLTHPVLGIGPDHWTIVGNKEFKDQISLYKDEKEAHTLWLQLGAELGAPGMIMILSFYGLCIVRVWRLADRVTTLGSSYDEQAADADRWRRCGGSMVIVPLCGFMVAAQFISLEFLEVPYYIVLIGAGLLKLEWASTRIDPGRVALLPARI